MQPTLPFFAEPSNVLLVFGIALIIFHLLFLVFWRMTKIQWKYIDYIWLTTGLIGVYGASIEVRRQVASSQINNARFDVTFRYERLRSTVEFLSGSSVCIEFNRTEYSPLNLEIKQREYNDVCKFAKSLLLQMPLKTNGYLDTTIFFNRPNVKDAILLSHYKRLDEMLNNFIAAEGQLTLISIASNKSDFERTMGLLSPFIFAIALAIRVTKVTGEIKLDKVA